MSDARERRRQRAQAEKRTDVMAGVKRLRVPIIIGVVWALVVAYNVAAAEGIIETGADDCPGHWHVGFSVWVEEQKLSFPPTGPGGDAAASPGAGFHLHGDDGIMHYHPGRERCMDLEGPLAKLGVEASGSSLVVRGQTYEENETHQVVVYHQPWGGEWKEVKSVGSFLDKQPGNGDRVMIAFMTEDSTVGVPQRQAQTADLTGGNYEPPPAGSGFTDATFIAITMATIFALLAIMLWYNFAKKTW